MIPVLVVRWDDIRDLRRFDNQIGALGSQFPKIAARALNRTGDMAKTQVIRALTKQTGLKRKVIVRAVKVKRASWDNLEFSMKSTGGDISLKYFDPRETRKGVSARPFGQRKVFPQSFLHGGRFPNRVPTRKLGGHVWKRIGSGRDIEKLNSGVIIPKEMVEGATQQAFERTVADVLPRRVAHEIGRLLK